jgi:hypothetical protein
MGNFFDPTHHIPCLTPNWPGWTLDEDITTISAQ